MITDSTATTYHGPGTNTIPTFSIRRSMQITRRTMVISDLEQTRVLKKLTAPMSATTIVTILACMQSSERKKSRTSNLTPVPTSTTTALLDGKSILVLIWDTTSQTNGKPISTAVPDNGFHRLQICITIHRETLAMKI